jgi:predicted Zn-dependent peptidase
MKVGRSTIVLIAFICLVLMYPHVTYAEGYRDLEKNVVEHTLPNGHTFLLVERSTAPVFSFCTLVHAGAVDEQYGIGGIAHMMEHMAFKGTETVGTTDFEAENEAMNREDDAYEALLDEKRKGIFADSTRLESLEAAFKAAQEEANQYVVPNEYSKILDRHGATGVNAGTGADMTIYFYSLPSNKIELWALMESDRLTNPVFREFYQENEVVQEERRQRLESSPAGRLLDEFLSVAFKEHPYGHGLIGTQSDLRSFTRREGTEFRNNYYVARNMTTVIVGDMDIGDTKKLLDTYFSAMPDRPLPPIVDTQEPPQAAERRIIMEDSAQPFFVVGYHIPDQRHPDYPAIQAALDILANGRTARLYKTLVKESKIAVQVGGFAGYPGAQYNTIAMVYAVASAGQDVREVETQFHEIVQSMMEEGITEEELDGYKARAKAQYIRQLRSDNGLARMLATYQEFYGGWRNLFRYLDTIDSMTTDDVQRVIESTFVKNNRTVGIIVPPAETGEEEVTQ